MELDNKKMWESLIRECDKSHDQSILNWIFNVRSALADQGLKYNTDANKIESIEPETLRFEKGKWYVKTCHTYDGYLRHFKEGCVYQAIDEVTITDGYHHASLNSWQVPRYFRLATPEEIPQEPKQENTLKGAVEARKEIITCAEDFQKQKTSDGELTEFEKEIAHVLVYKCYDGNLETEEEIHNAHRQYYDDAKFFAPMLLAKARKQLQPEIDAEIDKAYKNQDNVQYKRGYNKAVNNAFDWLYKLYDKQGYLDETDLDEMKEAIKGE